MLKKIIDRLIQDPRNMFNHNLASKHGVPSDNEV